MANYRRDDPVTSMLAGEYAELSGTAKGQRQLCHAAVTRLPGRTAREIEDQIGIKAHKRLPELRQRGLVSNGEMRRCSVSGRLACTWYPVRPHQAQNTLFGMD